MFFMSDGFSETQRRMILFIVPEKNIPQIDSLARIRRKDGQREQKWIIVEKSNLISPE